MTTKSTKSWNKVAELFSEVLSASLAEKEVKKVMADLTSKKAEISELLSKPEKRKKDPNAPKKAMSAYIFFCNDKRDEVKKKNPDLEAKEVTSRLGAEWKKLTDKQKEKYNKMAAEDKERFAKENADYVPADGEEETTSKKKKDPNAPKKPLTAYQLYCKDQRDAVKAKFPKLSGGDVTKKLGEMWKALSKEEQAAYSGQSKKTDDVQDADDSDTESKTASKKPAKKETKKEAPKKESKTEAKSASKDSKKEAPKKETVKPAAKAKGKDAKFVKTPGFKVFADEQRDDVKAEHPDWKAAQVDADLIQRWNELNDEDRELYENETAEQDE